MGKKREPDFLKLQPFFMQKLTWDILWKKEKKA